MTESSQGGTSKRRGYRPGWKSLTAALLLLAAVWPAARIVRIKAAVARVKAAGGRVVVRYSPVYRDSEILRCYSLLTGDAKIRVAFDGSRIGDADLIELADLHGLDDLRLGDTAVTDAGLKCLPDHGDFRRLSLEGAAIDDAGLASLRDMTNFRSLDLAPTKISDAGL